MKAILALAQKTIRSALRSHVVHVLLALLVLASLLLPLTVKGEGTAQSQVQVSLTFALSAVGILLSLSSLWMGCTALADEIETYQLHMITSKPVSRTQIWMGKWLGVVMLHGVLLALSAIAILSLTLWRVNRVDFPPQQRQALEQEVLTGRVMYGPRQPDLARMTEEEINHRVNELGKTMPEAMTKDMLRDAIRSEIEDNLSELEVGEARVWQFQGLPQPQTGDTVTLRYRLYLDANNNRDQTVTRGMWSLLLPKEQRAEPIFIHDALGGVFIEQTLAAEHLINDDGTCFLMYGNADPNGRKAVFQRTDGPFLLVHSASFTNNYARMILVYLLQLMFLAALGCTAGGALSLPVAIFIAVAYLMMGVVINTIEFGFWEPMPPPPGLLDQVSFHFGQFLRRLGEQKGVGLQLAYIVRSIAERLVVSIDQLQEVSQLARGELITNGRLFTIAFEMLVLRALPIAGLGIYLFNRRELGLVVRR